MLPETDRAERLPGMVNLSVRRTKNPTTGAARCIVRRNAKLRFGDETDIPVLSSGDRLGSEAVSASYSATTPTSTGSGTVALKMSMMLRRLVGDLSPSFSAFSSTTSLSCAAFGLRPSSMVFIRASIASRLADASAPPVFVAVALGFGSSAFLLTVRLAGAAAFAAAAGSALTGAASAAAAVNKLLLRHCRRRGNFDGSISPLGIFWSCRRNGLR